ncbi:MAG TPA: hypothetical protein VKB88_27640 [Bryobacteraceae bacterium]|nr:hypothetical protein [Bryobacteraceae bacterium]
MKTIANRIFQCAAGAVLLSASAFAQSNMTANIPFAFHANKVNMPAGSYRVDADTTHGGTPVIVLRSQADQNKAIALGTPLGSPADSKGPRLVFHCSESGCDLRQVWTPEVGYGYPSNAKEHAGDRVASIPLTSLKAD